MCGIWGWQMTPEGRTVGDLNIVASVLALQNESRGPDSFGWALWVPESKEPTIYKSVGRIGSLAQFHGVLPSQALMHTRRATTGAVTKENAHPWKIGNIVGAHNGMIFDHDLMNTKYDRKYNVDSQHLIAHIAEGKPLEELHGWGSVEYVRDDNPSRVYLGYTSTGTLSVASIRHKNGQGSSLGIVWSSDPEHLARALSLAGYYHRTLHVKPNKLYAIENATITKAGKFRLGNYAGQWNSTVWDNDGDDKHVAGYDGYNHWGGYRTDRRDTDKDSGWRTVYPKNKETGTQLKLLPKETPIEVPKNENLASNLVTDQAQCDSCSQWMLVAETGPGISKVVVPDKIFYLYEIDKWLCGKCFLLWLHKGDIDKRYYEGSVASPLREQTP